MKIASLPLIALAALPLSVEPAPAPPTAAPLAPRLARVVAVDADDVGELRRLAELALRADLSRSERAVLCARFADRVRAIDARAHGAVRARDASTVRAHEAGGTPLTPLDLTARGLGLERVSLASPAEALRARAALDRAAAELARMVPRGGG